LATTLTGDQGLEVLLGVLLLKASYQRRVPRDNHEDPRVNRRYGLLEELGDIVRAICPLCLNNWLARAPMC